VTLITPYSCEYATRYDFVLQELSALAEEAASKTAFDIGALIPREKTQGRSFFWTAADNSNHEVHAQDGTAHVDIAGVIHGQNFTEAQAIGAAPRLPDRSITAEQRGKAPRAAPPYAADPATRSSLAPKGQKPRDSA
jgi:hypothetical protein